MLVRRSAGTVIPESGAISRKNKRFSCEGSKKHKKTKVYSLLFSVKSKISIWRRRESVVKYMVLFGRRRESVVKYVGLYGGRRQD